MQVQVRSTDLKKWGVTKMPENQVETTPQRTGAGAPRNRRRRGSETLEFTFMFAPLFAMLFLVLNIAWGIFTKASIQWAVRMGVRQGVVATSDTVANAGASSLTDLVQKTVKRHSFGLVSDTNEIHICLWKVPDTQTGGTLINVTYDPAGNNQYNIMQVSVENHKVPYFLPFIFDWHDSTTTGWYINAASADRIEPNSRLPQKGNPNCTQ